MNFDSSSETIGWLKDRYLEGSLTLKPPYQRKPVWVARQRCYLIESILMGLPVPEVYIQRSTTAQGETSYAVVDGQQRIRTVLEFIGVEKDPDEEDWNKFSLDKLAPSSAWKDLALDDLPDEEKKAFYGFRFAMRYLDTDDDEQVRDMFRRLNKYLSPLKPQELRNATYSGPFVGFALRLAEDEYWVENGIVTPTLIRRMGDVEFVSELIIGILHGPQGGSSKVIDSYYEQYEDYDDEFPGQREAANYFTKALAIIREVFPAIRGVRWHNRADFYSLFVAIGARLREGDLARGAVPRLKKELLAFAEKVDRRLANEKARVGRNVAQYVRAVEKGVNDKHRRVDRHAPLVSVIAKYFG